MSIRKDTEERLEEMIKRKDELKKIAEEEKDILKALE